MIHDTIHDTLYDSKSLISLSFNNPSKTIKLIYYKLYTILMVLDGVTNDNKIT
jgi:hypothetical protein